jgi:hypothetical protein
LVAVIYLIFFQRKQLRLSEKWEEIKNLRL